MIALYADAMLCQVFPRLARWTAVVVDRYDEEEWPIDSVRLRWRRSADRWVAHATRRLLTLSLDPVKFAARPIRRDGDG